MTSVVNFRMESDDKALFESVCKPLGMNVSTALNIFAKKVCRERRIPFDVSMDGFYSEENMNYLDKKIREIESGKAKIVSNALIESDGE